MNAPSPHRRTSPRRRAVAAALPLLVLTLTLTCASAHAERTSEGPGAVLPVFERVLSAEQLCDLRFLLHLGWRFERDPAVGELTVAGGQPGRYETLAAAQAAGALRLRVPRAFDEVQARAAWPQLAGLADAAASRLAYKHRLAIATRRATARLSQMTERGRFGFPELLGIVHSPTFALRMPRTGWVERGRLFYPLESPSHAMECFFQLGATAECYVGQLLAVFSAQYELFGRDWFDEMFTTEELALGRPQDVAETPLLAAKRWDDHYPWRALLVDLPRQRMDPILVLAEHGPMAFAGTTGVVLNQDPEAFTQDNLVIVSITQRAVDDLVRGGGVPFFARECGRVWEHANRGKGFFTSASVCNEAERQVEAVFAQSFFQETVVYVHPDGVVPLHEIIRKRISQTDTPLTLRINLNGLDDRLYQRFKAAWRRACLGPGPPRVEAPARAD